MKTRSNESRRSSTNKIKNNKYLRIALLVFVVVLFAVYFIYNQNQFERIGNLTLLDSALIVLGQSIVILSNIAILFIFVLFIKKRMDILTASRVTAYSSLINFFGFLQGGVGLRAVYLKRYFDMSYRHYFVLTVVQYLALFATAGVLIIVGVYFTQGSKWSLTLITLGVAILVVTALVVKVLRPKLFKTILARLRSISIAFQAIPLVFLLLAIFLQFAGSLLAAAVELNAIGANVTLGSLLVYVGVSQFSIVIALTPGAIGIREGLLLIVQGQMQLTADDIVVAATIDRGLYFVTLAIFTPLALSAKSTVLQKTNDQK